jgi:hypothetical protein
VALDDEASGGIPEVNPKSQNPNNKCQMTKPKWQNSNDKTQMTKPKTKMTKPKTEGRSKD